MIRFLVGAFFGASLMILWAVTPEVRKSFGANAHTFEIRARV